MKIKEAFSLFEIKKPGFVEKELKKFFSYNEPKNNILNIFLEKYHYYLC